MSEEAVVAMVDALNALQVPYMVTGSLASNFHGVARSTQDADFVVQLGAASIGDIAQRLGSEFRVDPQLPFETITGTTRYVIRHAATRFTMELFLLSDDPHDRQRFDRRRQADLGGYTAMVPTAEDVVITKLRWSRRGNRTKDRDDARYVCAVQGDRLDWSYIFAWCDRHGTRELLEELRRSIQKV